MADEGSCGEIAVRRRWTEAEKRRLVSEVSADGVTISAVARRHGVHPSVLGRWVRRWKPEAPPPALVPVMISEDASPVATDRKAPPGTASAEESVEVVLTNGRRLVVREGISPSCLRRLVSAVDGA